MFITPPRHRGGDRCWYLLGKLQGFLPVDMLLDTGATFSLLPSKTYDSLPAHVKPELRDAGPCTLTGFTGERAKVRGRVTLTFGTKSHSWQVDFIVAYGVQSCILGVDFMNKYGVRIDYAQGLVWLNQTYSPMLRNDLTKPSACIKLPHNLLPRTESMVEAFVEGFPPNSVVMVEGTMEDLEKGIVLANAVVSLGEGGRCLLRVMNPHIDPLMIQPKTPVGMVSLVSEVKVPYPLA